MKQVETSFVMNFTLPVEAKELFTFISLPENMVLYTGFFLIPGIKNVISSDHVRRVGTIDTVFNNDGSSHKSQTQVFDFGQRYSLELGSIKMTGFKAKLATPIIGFKEDWILTSKGNTTSIKRSIEIIYKKGLMNDLFVKYFVCPQLYFSFVKHHQNIAKKFA